MSGTPAWGSRVLASDSSGDSDNGDGCGCMRHHHQLGWGGPTGSPWPWWAGMPLSQISLATGGAWPWAFGPPLFLPPPPRPPLPIIPLGFGLGNNNNIRLSTAAVFTGRLSFQAVGVPGAAGLGFGFGGGPFNVNGGVNGFGFFR